MKKHGILNKGMIAATLGMMALSSAGMAAAGTVDDIRFETVADYSSSFWYKDFQQPYFETTLPEASGGKLTANAVPFDQLGLTGFELMKLLRTGVYDIASGSLAYVTQDSPEMEGASLAAVTPDIASFKAAYEAYRPVLDREFAEKYNSKLLAIYAWPQSQLYCNLGDKSRTDLSLADLEGKKIRSFGTAISDFIEGLGAVPVAIPFAEVVTALQRGTADCFMASSLSAYNAKLYQVVTHVFPLNANYSASYVAINLDTWNSLTPEAQAVLETSMTDLQARMLDQTAEYESGSQACMGSGDCPYGENGNLTEVALSDDDLAKVKGIIETVILPRWADRCGSERCIDDWNATVGPVVGYSIAK
ncbi:TRAP transporter substrate-binding protein [Salipiger sp.]|uniref:TRAP transporter substrate-binding protein n=1 Tax=Salipiger sp. TaxID=2078585 RepID=UPI003A9843A5